MKISICGLGFVGMSLTALLSKYHEVIAFDIDEHKVNKLNSNESTVDDLDIEKLLQKKIIKFIATTDFIEAFQTADIIIIAIPTNYDDDLNKFDLSGIESAIEKILSINTQATIIIKSTIPVGFTEFLREKYNYQEIIFSPEFLREGKALHDNLYPSRVVVGDMTKKAELFGKLMIDASNNKDAKMILTASKEAEAMKLFANSYLAMRVAFFNELDNFAILNGLNAKNIIDGISLDPRIGSDYNNPSFGFGGYCLPKDTKQLLSHFQEVPQKIMQAIVDSNIIRKSFIAKLILDNTEENSIIGFYRFNMKAGSQNCRESASFHIAQQISQERKIIFYEPYFNEPNLRNLTKVESLNKFLDQSELIVTNRIDKKIDKYKHKIFSRDIFGEN